MTMKFKLHRGKHIQKSKTTGKSERFNPGDIIESDFDLTRLNGGVLPLKFERVGDTNVPNKGTEIKHLLAQKNIAPINDADLAPARLSAHERNKLMENLNTFGVKELQQYCVEEGIDIKGMTKKDDILKLISQVV